MQNLAVTNLISSYHCFSKQFWLGYKTLEKLYPNFEDIRMLLLKSKRIDPKYYKDIPNYELEKSLLEKEWNDKNEEAKQTGITTHEYIRNLFITNPLECKKEFCVPTDQFSIQQQLNVDKGMFIEYRLEIPLDENYTLVGVPDYFLIENGKVHIKDWKTSDEPIKFKAMYEMSRKSTKKLKHPISSLDDVNGVHYQLQLSIYMWMILKLRPDLKPGTLEIVWIKDNKIRKVYPVEYLEKQVDKLLKWHVKNLKLQEEMMKCREIKY